MANSESDQLLHFVLFPFMAQGHLIPMTDFGRLLARHGVIVTIVTTPVNAARIRPILTHAIDSGLEIQLVQIPFPCAEVGLPEGAENIDLIQPLSMELSYKFFTAANMVHEAVAKLFEKLDPRPNCIISDMVLPYTAQIAKEYNIPRISFHGYSSFCSLCFHNLRTSKAYESIESNKEYFTVPNMPEKVEFTKSQLSLDTKSNTNLGEISERKLEAELVSYGMIVNTFEELEAAYVKQLKKAKNDKLWCVGPVSLCNKDKSDIAQRGNNASINTQEIIEWLDSQQPKSVIYVCLGSMNDVGPSQLIELGLGLEASKTPFIWVIRGYENSKGVKDWIEENRFEDRVKGRGFIIWGWSPQVLILSNPAIGGFLTHCGWNSTTEGICAGVPLITWPLFGDQFCNEKLIVQILKIGIRVGAEEPRRPWEGENVGVLVKMEDVRVAVERLMENGGEEEIGEMRERAEKLGGMAMEAIEEGGSSFINIQLLIQDIMDLKN